MNIIILLSINVIRIYKYAIIARILLSWFQSYPSNQISLFIYKITDPILSVFKRFIPPIGMIDLSPLVAFFVLDYISIGLLRFLS